MAKPVKNAGVQPIILDGGQIVDDPLELSGGDQLKWMVNGSTIQDRWAHFPQWYILFCLFL